MQWWSNKMKILCVNYKQENINCKKKNHYYLQKQKAVYINKYSQLIISLWAKFNWNKMTDHDCVVNNTVHLCNTDIVHQYYLGNHDEPSCIVIVHSTVLICIVMISLHLLIIQVAEITESRSKIYKSLIYYNFQGN